MTKKNGILLSRIITITVVVVILSGVFYVFSSLFSEKTVIAQEKIATVTRGDLLRSVVATGRIEPVSKIDIKAKASGIIQYMYVDDGSKVTRGQILLELDREQLEASRREAEANLMARKAMLEKARTELKSAALSYERAVEEAKRQDLEFARREYERMRSLHQDNLISKSQLDEAEQLFRSEQVKDKVLANTVLLKESEHLSAQKAIHQAEAEIYASEAALQRAMEALANATIRSPIEGVVLKRYLEVGDAVSSILQLGSNATLIMTIGDTAELYFRGDVDESDVGEIRPGLPVNLTVETYRDKVFPGEVTLISPMGEEKDNVTRFEIRAKLKEQAGILKANMSANAEVVLERRAAVLIVPETAMIYDADKKPFVERYSESGGKQVVEKIPVTTGINNGSKVEIKTGLKEKDQVVMQ